MTSPRGIKFGVVVLVVQAFFVLFIGLFGEYKDKTAQTGMGSYANFQDVNVMIFVGFGFLVTFMKNYGYSGVGLNMLLSTLCIQWAAIVIGFIHSDILGGGKFTYGVENMVESLFASATVLISYCALLGKTSPIQLLVMGLFEIVFAQINKYIGVEHFGAVDIGESMYLHMFGAYFGMAVARVLYNPTVEELSDKQGSVYHSDLFSMIGTLFLWMYWPSFNGGFAGDQSEIAVVNTFLSLCAACVVTFAISALSDEKGKFDMVHIQNATLAGGVAVGACANMPMKPFAALLTGGVAGAVCTLGYKYVTPFLSSKLKIHDTCGVHNLHGLPAWIAAISAAILAATATLSDWGTDVLIFPDMSIVNGTLAGRSPGVQGGYQIAAAAVTMIFAIVSGIVTGFILKIPIWNQVEEGSLFDDRDNWELPDGIPYQLSKSKSSNDTPM